MNLSEEFVPDVMLSDIILGWSEPHQVRKPRRKYKKKRMCDKKQAVVKPSNRYLISAVLFFKMFTKFFNLCY